MGGRKPSSYLSKMFVAGDDLATYVARHGTAVRTQHLIALSKKQILSVQNNVLSQYAHKNIRTPSSLTKAKFMRQKNLNRIIHVRASRTDEPF